MTNVCVLTHELASTYLATKVFAPALKGIASIWRCMDVNPAGPVQDHVPNIGCGPRLTLDPAATVAVDTCCHAAPFTCRKGVIGVGVHALVPTISDIAVEA